MVAAELTRALRSMAVVVAVSWNYIFDGVRGAVCN